MHIYSYKDFGLHTSWMTIFCFFLLEQVEKAGTFRRRMMSVINQIEATWRLTRMNFKPAQRNGYSSHMPVFVSVPLCVDLLVHASPPLPPSHARRPSSLRHLSVHTYWHAEGHKKSTQRLFRAAIFFVCVGVKPVLNWANVCSPEHTSDTSTNYDSFLNWTFTSPNMVRTVQTLLHSQLVCYEMQASARTCCRRAEDGMIENVG